MSRVNGSQRFDAVRYSLEVVIIRTMTDNVGNEATEELTVILDTDEVISVNGIPIDMGVTVPIIDDECEIIPVLNSKCIFN